MCTWRGGRGVEMGGGESVQGVHCLDREVLTQALDLITNPGATPYESHPSNGLLRVQQLSRNAKRTSKKQYFLHTVGQFTTDIRHVQLRTPWLILDGAWRKYVCQTSRMTSRKLELRLIKLKISTSSTCSRTPA